MGQQETTKATVLGGGSFGTVLANLLAENGIPTHLWMRDTAQALEIQKTGINQKYIPGLQLSENLTATAGLQSALSGSELVLVSVPSKVFRETLKKAVPFLAKDAAIICSAKGIEAGSFKLMSEVMAEELTEHRFGVISGPNLAVEIAQKQLTGTVIASSDKRVCKIVQAAFDSDHFRVYANADIYGVELGGVLKNIYAIMAGMASSLEVGQNTLSLLMTRSITEMSRFAVELGANPMTFIGLAGMGDLIVTCSSPLSRNFRIGLAIGKGLSLDEAIEAVGQTAEGVNTLKLVKKMADEKNIDMPLASGLYNILFNDSTVDKEISALMKSDSSRDVDFIVGKDLKK